MDLAALGGAILHIAQPWTYFMLFIGTLLGIVVGAIPGLSGAMLIALTLPLTFYMQQFDAVVHLISMYVGAISGGLISATLLRMPGTPASVMTTFDGYPMAQSGRPGRALGLGITASFVGGMVAWAVLLTISKPLSILATRFGPFEHFTLIMTAMVLIVSASEGSLVKGLISGLLGSVVACTTAENVSSKPEAFGTGSEEGIIASEGANNATVGGALIPLIAMGIPGSVIDAILIGALMIHSIQPGPTLFLTNNDIVWGMIAACLLANIMMWLMMTSSVKYIARLIYLPRGFVLPIVMMFCVIGSYALNNTMFDVWVMLGFGVVGFLLEKARIPLGPFVIGFVLAPLAEEKRRSGLMMTAGDFTPIFTRPFPLAFALIPLALLLWPIIGDWRRKRSGS
jgi:putative tricarboxylic transport membrane protein